MRIVFSLKLILFALLIEMVTTLTIGTKAIAVPHQLDVLNEACIQTFFRVLIGQLFLDSNKYLFRVDKQENVYVDDLDTGLSVARLAFQISNDCISFRWQALTGVTLEDCFLLQSQSTSRIEIEDTKWYGGPELYGGPYSMGPDLASTTVKLQQFISSDIYRDHKSLGGVLEPLWLTSTGWFIEAAESFATSLFLSFNNGDNSTLRNERRLCFRSSSSLEIDNADHAATSSLNSTARMKPALGYRICSRCCTRQSWQADVLSSIAYEAVSPKLSMIEDPIWSTWAEFKKDVNQAAVLAYAADIVAHGYPHSVLELDDRWSLTYGDLAFDALKFPDPAGMVRELRELNFSVTLWVLPFCQPSGSVFEEGVRLGYWVMQEVEATDFPENGTQSVTEDAPASPTVAEHATAIPVVESRVHSKRMVSVPYLLASPSADVHTAGNTTDGSDDTARVRWWDDKYNGSAVLDVTNPAARRWFVSRLRAVKATFGVIGFKFDAGEVFYIPSPTDPSIKYFDKAALGPHGNQPLEYTKLYVSMAAELGDYVEVRSAWHVQSLGVFVRVMDLDSVWGSENGIESGLQRVLLFSTLGYRYTLPDMVGGNGYGPNGALYDRMLPPADLYIRWIQMNLLMPMQLSIPPWRYTTEKAAGAAEVLVACERVFALRELLKPFLRAAAELARTTGVPIVRPMWAAPPPLPPVEPAAAARPPSTASTTTPTSAVAAASPACPASFRFEENDGAGVHGNGIDDQYMVDDDVVVAPVLWQNATERMVNLPAGRWIPCVCFNASRPRRERGREGGPGAHRGDGGSAGHIVNASGPRRQVVSSRDNAYNHSSSSSKRRSSMSSRRLRREMLAAGSGLAMSDSSQCGSVVPVYLGPVRLLVNSSLLSPPPCFVRATNEAREVREPAGEMVRS